MIQISRQAKLVWKDAVENGIKFKIIEQDAKLEPNYDGMKVGDASTLCVVEDIKSRYKGQINRYEGEITRLVIFRTRLEELLSMLSEYPVDETNRDLIKRCIEKLDGKL